MTSMRSNTPLDDERIINEHYSLEEYVKRRVGYLGKHPDYKRVPKLFPIVRRDAGDIFRFEQEVLSVQEVRRRELKAELDVLLPLPTRENTMSLDSFKSYPDREWSPGVPWPIIRPATDDEDQDNLTAPDSPTATSAHVHMSHPAVQPQTPAQQSLLDFAQPSSASTQRVTPPTLPAIAPSYLINGVTAQVSQDPRSSAQIAMTQPAANTHPDVASPEQTVTTATTPASQQMNGNQFLPGTVASSSSPMADPTSTGATTPMAPLDARQQELVRLIIDNLGNKPAGQQAPPSSLPVSGPHPAEQNVTSVAPPVNGTQTTEQQRSTNPPPVSDAQTAEKNAPAPTPPFTGTNPTEQQAPPSTPSTSGSQPIEQHAPISTPPNHVSATTEEQSPPSTSSVRVGNNVAALAGRGMSVPVKQKLSKKSSAATSPPAEVTDSVMDNQDGDEQMSDVLSNVDVAQTRGKKRAASELADEVSPFTTNGGRSSEQVSEGTPPAAKKLKALRGPRKPVPTPSTRPSTPAKSKSKKKATPARSSTVDDDHMESIINGTALPNFKAEAKQASQQRHDRLLAHHDNTRKASATSRARRAPAAGGAPDLMPEFFNAAAFPDEEQVRCICGVVEDDFEKFVYCDGCTVWQHVACMGANKNKKKALCQVCDPWTHRELVAKLRREHPIE